MPFLRRAIPISTSTYHGTTPVTSLRVIHLTSIDQLREESAAWDDLWWRSHAALPTARAELIAQWVEHFRPRAAFRAIVVERRGRWVAALPLIGQPIGWMFPVGRLPGNAWSTCGELLLDASTAADADDAEVAGADAVMDHLVGSASCLPWPLLWLDEAVPESPQWQSLLDACDRTGILSAHHERYRVGRVEIGCDWDLYQQRLHKRHRQNINRLTRRLRGMGELHLERCSHLDPAEVESRLQTVFEIEDRSWKGQEGTSVLKTDGMLPFFVRQAEQLAEWGQLEIATLRLDDRIIAFVYGFCGKGIYFVNKIGYDPEFASFGPGQVLFGQLLEQLHGDGDVHALDFMGPMTESLARWQPATYGVGRIVLALRWPLGSSAMYAYQHWWPRIRRLKQGAAAVAAPCAAESPSGELAEV
jgi:CelD/BcsL family acetyltransferase involved in cellulose biosynthesis